MIVYKNMVSTPSTHSFFLKNLGTAPNACTFQFEASDDGNPPWVPISDDPNATNPSPVLSCMANATFTLAYRAFHYIRANILSYVQADNTTAPQLIYIRGGQ